MDIKRMNIKEFVKSGWLQEVNRQFFHPAGLALEVKVTSDGEYQLSGIQDSREDSEGMNFAKGAIDPEKTAHVEKEFNKKRIVRYKNLGYWVQPVRDES